MSRGVCLCLLAGVVALTACQRNSSQGNAPPASLQAAPVSSSPPVSSGAAQVQQPSAALSSPTSAPVSGPAAPAKPAHAPVRKPTPVNAEDSMIDVNSEGGTRGAKYALWVRALRDGKALQGVQVRAFQSPNHQAVAAVTDNDGYARLLVDEGTYRVTAMRGPLHAVQSVDFHAGQEIALELSR